MGIFRNSLLRAFLASTLLVSWLGANHHDTWLELAGIEHHHFQKEFDHDHHNHGHHHHKHGHSHHHGESHAPDRDDTPGDDNDSIPMPDSHSSFFATLRGDSKTIISFSTLEIEDAPEFSLITLSLNALEKPSTEGTPPDSGRANHSTSILLLRNSIHSNAPPAIS